MKYPCSTYRELTVVITKQRPTREITLEGYYVIASMYGELCFQGEGGTDMKNEYTFSGSNSVNFILLLLKKRGQLLKERRSPLGVILSFKNRFCLLDFHRSGKQTGSHKSCFFF